MQQSSAISVPSLSPEISRPSMRDQKDESGANASHYGCTDRAYHDENIFSTNASVKTKLCHASNSDGESAGDAAMCGTSDQRVTLRRDLVSDISDHCATVNRETGSDVNSHFGVGITDISPITNQGTVLSSEAHGTISIHSVSVNEALTSDEAGVGEGARQAEVHSTEAASSNSICAMGNRNPEFYSPTRKLDFTKKLSNKGLNDPLPGDAEETTTVVKKKQNPLKRLFARKKGKFDPAAADVSQYVLPSTDQEIASKSNKKHVSPSSKFNLRIGKKKSQEVFDLNSSSGAGSNLEIDQIQDNLAASNSHKTLSDININDIKGNIVSDLNIAKHGEESSKGRNKTRVKLTKDNIIVIKSTGKFMSHFGSTSIESVSATDEDQTEKETAQVNVSVTNEEKAAKEAVQVNVNRQNNSEHQQLDNNHQHESLDDDDDDDDDDDLSHLDDMLNHIYANFSPMGTVFSLPLTTNDGVSVSDRDETTSISASKRDIENSNDKEQTGEIDVGNIDDQVQAGEVDIGNIYDQVQKETTWQGYIDDIPHEKVILPQDTAIHMKNTAVTVLGEENTIKDTIVSQDEIKVETCVDKIQGEEITVDNTHDKVKRREIIVENLAAGNPTITCETEHLHPLEDNKFKQDNGESNKFSKETIFKQNYTNVEGQSSINKPLDFSTTDRFDRLKLASFAGDNDLIDYTSCGDNSTAVNIALSSAAHNALTLDGLTLDVNIPDTVVTDEPIYDFVGDTATVDYVSRDDITTYYMEHCSPTPAEVVESKAVIPQDDIPTDYTEHCSPTLAEVIECEAVIAQDVVTNDLTASSVIPPDDTTQSDITKDGALHDTTNPAIETHDDINPEDDVSSCSANELPASTQTVECLPCVDPVQISSDFDTNDLAKSENTIRSTFHSHNTESLSSTEAESSRRRGPDGIGMNNIFTERVQEIKDKFCKDKTTYESLGDRIVQFNTTKSGTVQPENKQSTPGSGSNDLLPLGGTSTIPNDHAKLSSRPGHTPHDQLQPAGGLHTTGISHNVGKPPIKPKPLIAQSCLSTSEVSNTQTEAGNGRHPLKLNRAVENVKVDFPASDLEAQAGTFISVECLKKNLEGGCSQNQDKENMNEHQPGHVDGSSNCKLSEDFLQAQFGYLQEHLTTAESTVSNKDCLNVDVRNDIKDEVKGQVSDDVSIRDHETAAEDKLILTPDPQRGDNFLEKSHDQTSENTNVASQLVQESTRNVTYSTKPLCPTSPDPHLAENLTELFIDEVLDTTVSTRLLVVSSQTGENTLQNTPDSKDDNAVVKIVDRNIQYSSNLGKIVESGTVQVDNMCKTNYEDCLHKTDETCVEEDQASTMFTGNARIRDTTTHDTNNSGYYEYALDHISSNKHNDNLDHVMNVSVEVIVDEIANSHSVSDYPDKNGEKTLATLEVESCGNVRHRDTHRDNIYEDIFEEADVKDVSCLTSKRFQFPWKKKEKKLDKSKDTKDCDNMVGKDKLKLKLPNAKSGIKPKPPPKVSECTRSRSNVQNAKNMSAKERSGKVRRKFASFTLQVEETLYHEIDEDLCQRKDVTMEDFSSSSSTTSDDHLQYELINYIQTDTDNNESEPTGLRQHSAVHVKSPLNSSDSLGYEIPAKFSLTAMGRAWHAGGRDTSTVEYPPDQDSSSLNSKTNEADGETQLGHDADLYSCEDLPTIGHDIQGSSGQRESSSSTTDVATFERSDYQTVLSGGVFPQFRQKTDSGDVKHRSEPSDAQKVNRFQTDSENEVPGYSTENIPTKLTSRGEITDNRDSECSTLLEGITLGESIRIPRVTATDECNIGECAPPPSQSISVAGEDTSRGRIGSSDSNDKGIEKTSLEEITTIETAHAEDGSRHGSNTSTLSENVTRNKLKNLKSGVSGKTGRFGDVKLPMDSKESGYRSVDVRAILNVDTETPHSPKSAYDADKHNTMSAGKNREIQAGYNQVVKNRQMLAGYNQVVKSLAAKFGVSNDSKNCCTERDNAGCLETQCSQINDNDIPETVCMHDSQRVSLANKDMATELHPVFIDAVTTNLQTTNCRSEHEYELSCSTQIDSGMLPRGSRINNISQGTPKVLSAARYPSEVPGCSRRRFFSLRHIVIRRDEKTDTERCFDRSMCAGVNSDETGLKVVRRSSSLPVVFISDTGKVTYHTLDGASLSVTSASQSIHNQIDLHLQQQMFMSSSKELYLGKSRELSKISCSSQEATGKITKKISGNQLKTTNQKNNKEIPLIPVTMDTATTDDAAHLTVTLPEDDQDDKPEYDLPPIRAKRISQSKILSWPGLPVSYTAQPGDYPSAVKLNQSLHLPGGNKAEYAAPWEDKDLDTLAPSLQLHNTQSSAQTVQGEGSSNPADCDQVSADPRFTWRSSETLDEMFVVSLGSSSEPLAVEHDDVSTTRMFGKKHRKLLKVVKEGDGEDTSAKKTSFLKLMTSLFHRKKKTFNVGGDHQQGDERTSDASEDEAVTFDFISSPLELASERDTLEAQTMTSHHDNTGVSASTKNAPRSGHIDECSVATVTNVRPLCRLLKINDDKTRTIEFVQPWLHYQGVSFTKNPQHSAREGVFVAPFVDNSSSKLLAGFLDVGDQVLEMDGVDVSHMSLDEINHLIQSKQHLTITIFPADAGDC